jgi:putative membrane protein
MRIPGKDANDPTRKIHPITTARAQQYVTQHLANERTYLAYLRTAIALISFGVTINRFSLFLIQSRLLPVQDTLRWNLVNIQRAGLGMVIFGIILVGWAVVHYTSINRQIERGNFRPSLWNVWAIAIAIVAGGGLGLLWLFHR